MYKITMNNITINKIIINSKNIIIITGSIVNKIKTTVK